MIPTAVRRLASSARRRVREHDAVGGDRREHDAVVRAVARATGTGDLAALVALLNLRVRAGLVTDVWIQLNPAKLGAWRATGAG